MVTATRSDSPIHRRMPLPAASGGAGSTSIRAVSAPRLSATAAAARLGAASGSALESVISAQTHKIAVLTEVHTQDQERIRVLEASLAASRIEVTTLRARIALDATTEPARVTAEASRLVTLHLSHQLFAKDKLGAALLAFEPWREEMTTRATTLDSIHLTALEEGGSMMGSMYAYHVVKINRHTGTLIKGRAMGIIAFRLRLDEVAGTGTKALMNRHFDEIKSFMRDQKLLTKTAFVHADLWDSYKQVKEDSLFSQYVEVYEPPIHPVYQNTYIMPTVLPWPPSEFATICMHFRDHCDYVTDSRAKERLALAENAERIGLGRIVCQLKPHASLDWKMGNRAPASGTNYRGLSWLQDLRACLKSFE